MPVQGPYDGASSLLGQIRAGQSHQRTVAYMATDHLKAPVADAALKATVTLTGFVEVHGEYAALYGAELLARLRQPVPIKLRMVEVVREPVPREARE